RRHTRFSRDWSSDVCSSDLREIGAGPELVEVPTPEPGPGEVRLKVTAAGACHSDIFVMELGADDYTFGLPLTLGHEGAGVVDARSEERRVGKECRCGGARGS